MTQARAVKAFKDFHGHEPKTVAVVDLPETDVDAYRMGRVEAIAYRAKRYGKSESYIHEFGRHAGPNLDVSSDGSQLYLTNGRYRITDHGIEDEKMPALLVVNPHKPGSKPKKVAMKRNSKGQFVKKTRAAPKRRKANPTPPARAAAPKRRRKANPAPPMATKRSAPKRRRLSNPSGRGIMGIDLMKLVTSGGSQAVGAVATSIIFAMIPLPSAYKNGPTGAIAKVATGIIGGMVISHFGKGSRPMQEFAQNFAEGTFTLAAVELIKSKLPSDIPMGLLEYDDDMGIIAPSDMGIITAAGDDGMGYLTAANVVDDRDLGLGGYYGEPQYQNFA